MTEITKSTEAKKDEMQVEKEKLESVKRADAAVKTMHDFTSPEVLYKELINSVLKYHPSTDISMIEKAYKVASEAHEGQKRKSGEPYIIHPLCVAIILADLELDKETIVAGLLHDAVEDTWMTYEEVEKEFGGEVALLVDGVTKIGQLSYSSDKVEMQAESLRKMFLAMAKDIRVILIKLADLICRVYLTVIRGTPTMVQLLIMFFIVLASSNNKVMVAVITFGVNSGAYVAEIFRSGIMSVDKGQMEAGRSLGFNYAQTMWYVIMPQAFKTVLPTLCNEFISLLKETSVSGYIAIQDLTKGGDIIRSRTYSAFMPLIAVALVYLVIVMIFTKLIQILERRLRQSER